MLSNYAGVILAAGKSERFGAAKILADWHGEVLLRKVTKKVLSVGLNPVLVVLGAIVDPAVASIRDLPVGVIVNENYASGIGSSFSAGVSSLPNHLKGVFLFLSDHPFFSKELLHSMITSAGSADVIVPTVDMKPGHPVLWNQQTFDRIRKMKSDETGKSIQNEFNRMYFPWSDKKILLDIDTQQDYQNLLEVQQDI